MALAIALAVASSNAQNVRMGDFGSKILNGTSMCDQYSGATPDLQIKACIADAIAAANGNYTKFADARGMTGTLVLASEIDVGNTSGNYVRLLVPCSGTWQSSVADGTSVTLKQFGGAEVVGCPVSSAGGLFYLGATSGSNLYAIYEQSGSSTPYIYAFGFNALNSSGHATASHYTIVVDGNPGGGSFSPFSDGSHVESVNVNDFSNPSGGGILFRNVCCSYTWSNSAFNSNGGGIPVTIQADDDSYVQGLTFRDDTIVDPGSGKPMVYCTDTRSPHVSESLFDAIYHETNGTDTNTALFQSPSGTPCSQMTIRDGWASSNVASNVSPLVAAPNTVVTVDNENMISGNGTWTYPANVTSSQKTDATGHIARFPAVFGPTYTVSTLPTASTVIAGTQIVVTDATSFTPGTCTGGGSDPMIAVSNGSTWSCH